jgi:hypothetical protein
VSQESKPGLDGGRERIAQLGLEELVTKTVPRELLTRALLLKPLLARRLLPTLPGLLAMHSLALP